MWTDNNSVQEEEQTDNKAISNNESGEEDHWWRHGGMEGKLIRVVIATYHGHDGLCDALDKEHSTAIKHQTHY